MSDGASLVKAFDLDKTITVRDVMAALEAAGGYEKYDAEQRYDHSIDLGEFGRHNYECDRNDELPSTFFDTEAFERELTTRLDAKAWAA